MSIWDIHYNALYASPIAVDAVLTVACGEMPVSKGADGGPLRAIDKTSGVVTGGGRFQSEVQTVKPAASLRACDLAGIEPEKLQGAELVINGKTWLVDTHGFLPAPTGEAAGEILLYLTER
ncbi:hypothetical protein [Mesorhizobium sp. NZP2077]|uniref:hypothetical protein n=1 Tax=Mesorhizobium sp. NZP2077 TaxID=2483404 RepID=UPI001554196E|nr:hypothetical protein [Mesorhizobium sp. NZP2077]QKC83273.1 hypothetical protein EB232_18100 [Mesorhizobium sp. NZP2077]QKD16789.1 hypothetical protein HGP13_17880 [Mesorhizobium sp. NZP2077]